MADETKPCVDCGKYKNDSHYHLDAPGTNWGAALHPYRAPADPAQSAPSAEEIYGKIRHVIVRNNPASLCTNPECASCKKIHKEATEIIKAYAALRTAQLERQAKLLRELDPFQYTVQGDDSCIWCRRDRPSVDAPWDEKVWHNPDYHDSDCEYLRAVAAQAPQQVKNPGAGEKEEQ